MVQGWLKVWADKDLNRNTPRHLRQHDLLSKSSAGECAPGASAGELAKCAKKNDSSSFVGFALFAVRSVADHKTWLDFAQALSWHAYPENNLGN
jgi:hypothetical protein